MRCKPILLLIFIFLFSYSYVHAIESPVDKNFLGLGIDLYKPNLTYWQNKIELSPWWSDNLDIYPCYSAMYKMRIHKFIALRTSIGFWKQEVRSINGLNFLTLEIMPITISGMLQIPLQEEMMYLFGEAGTGAVLYKVNSYNPPNGMIGVYREKSFAFLETSEFYAGVEIYPVNWIMLFGRAGLVFGGFTSYGIAGNIDLSGISIGCGAMISPFPLKSRRR